MHNLGSIFYNANDYKTSALWFQRAVNHRFAPSQRNLARMANDNLIDPTTVYFAEKHRPYPSPTLLKPNPTAFEAYSLPPELQLGSYQLSPIYGDPVSLEYVTEQLKTVPHQQKGINGMLINTAPDLTHLQTISDLLADEQGRKFLCRIYNPIIGFKNKNSEIDKYFQAAVDQIIASDQPAQAYNFLKFLYLKAGSINLFSPSQALPYFISLESLLRCESELAGQRLVQPYMDQIQIYLNIKKAYTPLFLTADTVQIASCNTQNQEQLAIIEALHKLKETHEKPSSDSKVSINGKAYQSEAFYGPTRFIGSLVYNQGDLEVISSSYVINKTTLLDGPALIKVKEFTLADDFAAAKGAVIIAEKFKFLPGRIWKPQNCHFIRTEKVKLDHSTSLND